MLVLGLRTGRFWVGSWGWVDRAKSDELIIWYGGLGGTIALLLTSLLALVLF